MRHFGKVFGVSAFALGGMVYAASGYESGQNAIANLGAREPSIEMFDDRSLNFLTGLYGDPKIEQFELTVNASEFQIELLEHYSAGRLAEDPPQMTQATFSFDASSDLTVWYESNEYIHHMLHGKNSDF